MRKIICLVSILIISILVTGCGGNKESVLTCKSEVHGENPMITSYEMYTIKNNKVIKMEAYDILDYEDNYLTNVTIDQIIEIYSKDSNYKVEKIDSNSIKNVKINPVNVFESIETDDMIELIQGAMEENEFGLYSYTCEVK